MTAPCGDLIPLLLTALIAVALVWGGLALGDYLLAQL
jgi:hypothetical protein